MKGNVEWSELAVSTSILLMVLCLGLGFNGFGMISILKEMSNEEWHRIIWNSIGWIIAGLIAFSVSMYIISKRDCMITFYPIGNIEISIYIPWFLRG